MKMRFAWYAGASAALAGSVIVSAFHQRANFYSAMVHLSQSSLSLMVLVNLVFVIYGSFIYLAQRLCFGPLRPVEIEQLYEKAWFAVTETCLAMTIFREEVGAFFLVMFTALVTGKVWGWIGEGRVEVLEQQPPANPRLFHTRLSISLLISVLYDTWLLVYAARTVVRDARPTMMVMFLFEFAVLDVCSIQTASRYIISLMEQRVVKVQTHQRLESRRRQIREQREAILRRRETGETIEGDDDELPDEDDVDEMDIEVPGWESKGQWVLTLDLIADFVKLGIYTAFFCVLMAFYGLPIHIIRDWFMTTRSFLKRLSALIRYRQAVRDMDKYPDASAEELGRDHTCIICREDMRPWDPTDPTQVERTRAKKLPCGHILHFGCLKSWLERQQVCPTCRRPVTREEDQPARNGEAMVFRLGLNFAGGQNRQPQPPANGQAGAGQAPAAPADNGNGQGQNRAVRMFNLGPLRLGIAQGGVNDIREMAQRLGMQDAADPPAAAPPAAPQQAETNPTLSLEQIRAQILDVWQRVQQELAALQNTANEIQTLNFVVNELGRLRQLQQQQQAQQQNAQNGAPAPSPAPFAQGLPVSQLPLPQLPHPYMAPQPMMVPPMQPGQFLHPFARPPASFTRHGAAGYGTAIPAGSPDLPEGVVIPPGWSLLPLQRLDGGGGSTDPASQATPQDTVQNSRHPRSPSSTAATQSSDPADRLAGGGGLPSDTTQNSRAQASSASLPHTQRPPAPSVTAPTPIAPNWGGPAQVFGLERSDIPTHHDEAGESSTSAAGQGRIGRESETQAEHEQGSSAASKGKARAATVEEDESDEDED
ncbi:ERAD-associated E3 ubiquitin-protein ligase HRD1 [Podospora aff. communis PSN243]|uniref:RING-type E3 ubiquitin transferase n=1 Tax=Podospora aff. communis PSN243 TaxID=3040156 RepID=A0AAV9GXF6_9PEZI|nr:ERAD-associated E3 ubiquitin-protein ligase HRD1 [Podospora aff. communis PSN243]